MELQGQAAVVAGGASGIGGGRVLALAGGGVGAVKGLGKKGLAVPRLPVVWDGES
jgi:hypothetical protein